MTGGAPGSVRASAVCTGSGRGSGRGSGKGSSTGWAPTSVAAASAWGAPSETAGVTSASSARAAAGASASCASGGVSSGAGTSGASAASVTGGDAGGLALDTSSGRPDAVVAGRGRVLGRVESVSGARARAGGSSAEASPVASAQAAGSRSSAAETSRAHAESSVSAEAGARRTSEAGPIVLLLRRFTSPSSASPTALVKSIRSEAARGDTPLGPCSAYSSATARSRTRIGMISAARGGGRPTGERARRSSMGSGPRKCACVRMAVAKAERASLGNTTCVMRSLPVPSALHPVVWCSLTLKNAVKSKSERARSRTCWMISSRPPASRRRAMASRSPVSGGGGSDPGGGMGGSEATEAGRRVLSSSTTRRSGIREPYSSARRSCTRSSVVKSGTSRSSSMAARRDSSVPSLGIVTSSDSSPRSRSRASGASE